ncbi:hypothetical protein HHK36_006378 [Tetracentron sinense]|uniref:Reticulon-like protein n=1 Tax=Tetracentron sinense TaxID=13715 RepID=A0A835DKV0_TETSI|nr:hypothetical protein HHK36_006378 [Tetracentron sinense]
MEVSRRRTAPRKGVVAGSVWESRMKNDEVKGGIKVFNGEENSEEGGGGQVRVDRKLKQNQNGGVKGRRKTWKSESVEKIEKIPIQTKKTRSESCKELSVSVDGIEKTPIQIRKTRSESNRVSDESCKDLGVCVDGNERNPILLRKTRSESNRVSDESCKDLGVSVDETERNPIQIRKTRSESNRVSDESCKEFDISVDEIERNPIQISKTISDSDSLLDESCKEFGVCTEKIISSSLNNVGQAMDDDGDEEDEGEDEEEIEMEIDNKSFDVKEINIPEQKPKKVEEKKLLQIPEKPIPISASVKRKPIPISGNWNKQTPTVIHHPLIDPNFTTTPPIAVSEEFGRIPVTQNKLQNIVDLVMWRDVSKSAFVFGLGTFIMLSSSFTKDLNFSLISAISYMGLFYLAAMFLFRSILCRGSIELDDSSHIYMVGEEEAIWFLKLFLPYLNEFLLKLRGLFSGDPSTTMKLAVLLFVLARCGSSITIWKMAKLGFFGVFTLPKVCSSYSTQLTGYGQFWVRRFRDAWDSCSHKKAVASAIFTLIWNLSSITARIWAVFMVVVAVRYYQQSLIGGEWEVEELGEEDGREGEGGQGKERGPTLVEVVKGKKGS